MIDPTLIRLYILSRLLDDTPVNPYRIFKDYQGSPSARFQPIEEAKFYYNIDLLHKQDYIAQTSVVPGENAPSKRMYAITQKGRGFFESALYEKFARANSVDDLYLTFPFLEFVDCEKTQRILRERIAELEHELEAIVETADDSFIVDYAIQKRRFHLTYLKKMLARMEQAHTSEQ